jgi:hypothetical protein
MAEEKLETEGAVDSLKGENLFGFSYVARHICRHRKYGWV